MKKILLIIYCLITIYYFISIVLMCKKIKDKAVKEGIYDKLADREYHGTIFEIIKIIFLGLIPILHLCIILICNYGMILNENEFDKVFNNAIKKVLGDSNE